MVLSVNGANIRSFALPDHRRAEVAFGRKSPMTVIDERDCEHVWP